MPKQTGRTDQLCVPINPNLKHVLQCVAKIRRTSIAQVLDDSLSHEATTPTDIAEQLAQEASIYEDMDGLVSDLVEIATDKEKGGA